MNRLRIIFSLLIVLMLCPMHKGVAQTTEQLSDSLVYSIAMYKELYRDYTNKKALLQQDIVGVVKEEYPDMASKVRFNTKFEALGLDLVSILDLAEVMKGKFGVAIAEEQAMGFAAVSDFFEAVRPKGDTIMLTMAYYPWRTVFESRQVHRVSVYEDGIGILGDLIELTTDSIQREIYLNELMDVYDVWAEYVDTINEKTDSPYSKTLILSEKARKYDEMLPVLYKLKWDVKGDTINSKPIQEHVFSPEVSRLYNYMRDALYDQSSKTDIYYEVPYKFFRLSHSRLTHLNKLGKYKTYADQYTKDFDSVNVRFELYKTLAMDQRVSGNIAFRHDEIADMYDDASGAILIGSSKDWRKKEPEFRRQLYEKMDLWDFGMEEPDPKFLNRVINGINTDSSEVYIEAMEIYINLPPTEEVFENIVKYRKKLAAYYMKNKRYDDAITLYRKVIGDEKDPIERAFAYFCMAECQWNKKDYSRAQSNYNNAIKYNKEYGDAYFKLALCYENMKFYKDATMDRYKFLLCIDKLNQAKDCVNRNGAGNMRKYNRTSESAINSRINELMTYCPTESDVFMLPPDFRTAGKTISFGKAGQTTIRFYSK